MFDPSFGVFTGTLTALAVVGGPNPIGRIVEDEPAVHQAQRFFWADVLVRRPVSAANTGVTRHLGAIAQPFRAMRRLLENVAVRRCKTGNRAKGALR